MSLVKPSASTLCATLIGDVIDSRRAADRRKLHDRLSLTLREVGATVPATTALQITVGDEFQGSYTTLGHAIDALFRIRMALLPAVHVRFGLGWGQVDLLDHATGTQDGPAWWAAREAIEAAKTAELRAATHAVRTVYRCGADTGPSPAAVNAALLCQDQLLSSLDDRSLRILRRLAGNERRTAIATAEGISPSAISQRIVSGGLEVIVMSARELAAVR